MAGQADSNVALALAQGKDIVGFGVLAYPDADERWSEMGDLMMEVNALEVAREWRSGKIARGLIQMLLSHPQLEEKIIYFVGYSWTWDLDGNGMSAIEYRQMMIHLFEPFGFQELQTNEPNICLKPENIFMGRIGAKVTEEEQHRFKWLRFGLSP
jgi:acetoin utilization protein AcuA